MSFNSDNYPILVKQLFDDETHAGIKEYIEKYAPLLPLQSDDSEFVRMYGHNVEFFVDIHYQLKNFASECFQQEVKPSYCFLSMYKENGICPLHIDRPQCRFTIDYLIQTTQEEPWPIHIGHHLTDLEVEDIHSKKFGYPESDEIKKIIFDREQWYTASLEENDAILYSGTHSWHYRSERLRGTADLVFFHFIPEDYNGPLD